MPIGMLEAYDTAEIRHCTVPSGLGVGCTSATCWPQPSRSSPEAGIVAWTGSSPSKD
jgi:hypothetical protein